MRTEQTRHGRPHDRSGGAVLGTDPEAFVALFQAAFPDAGIQVDPPAAEDGEWWIDLESGGFSTSVSWRSGRGYGLYVGEPGYGERPDEVYSDPRMAVRRLHGMAATWTERGEVRPMEVGQVRKLLGRTQGDLAAALAMGQANVSRIEGRANPTVGSLRALVEAMGGRLEVRARFPSLDVPLALPAPDAED